MADKTTTLQTLKERVDVFMRERDWNQFHSPKNLSMNIAIEASELMEKFLWVSTEDSYKVMASDRQEIEDEVADIFMGLLDFCSMNNIDLSAALHKKMQEAAAKYPIEKARGNYRKYDKL